MCPGRISRPQNQPSQPLKSAFDVLDADQDGKISANDLHASNPNATAKTIDSMISVADLDKNGFVEYDEFERVVKGSCKTAGFGGFKVVEEMFEMMDGDKDGKVGFEDLKRWFRLMGMKVGEEEIKVMVRMGGDGGVSVDGLKRILGIVD